MDYVKAKHIITKGPGDSWFGGDYNMNIYRGCCHGCIYCDSRSDCYHIENFDQVKAKEHALEIIRDDLRRKTKKGVVATGAMSDPYNPFEKELMLTRHAQELLNAFGFGSAIATKSAMITRDIDILEEIKEHSPVICKLTITTCDDSMCKKIEPGVSLSSERFEALAKLKDAGIFAGILMMPVLPWIEDTEENILGIVKKAKECGADFIYPAFGVTLRQNQREWYFEKLDRLFPDDNLREKYKKRYGDRYQCASPHAKQLWSRFVAACNDAGILFNMRHIITAYRRPYEARQMSFFDQF